MKFIRAHKDEPFFLYLPHSAVHFPIYPGKAFQGKSNNGIYGDWVEEVDWSVGQVLDTVRQLGLSDNTLVIFTSDNGGTQRGVNAPLRGYKGSTWEGGMREPTIAWWPGKIPAGTETDAVTSMMDILPTFVKLAGGSPPTDRTLDGRDIWPLLADEPGATSPHDVFYYYRGLNLQAVRSGPWKLHLAKTELYNLETDIGEAMNVAAAHPEIVQRLQKLANKMEDDLGLEGIGPGCRPLGKVANAQPIIDHDGTFRTDSGSAAASGRRSIRMKTRAPLMKGSATMNRLDILLLDDRAPGIAFARNRRGRGAQFYLLHHGRYLVERPGLLRQLRSFAHPIWIGLHPKGWSSTTVTWPSAVAVPAAAASSPAVIRTTPALPNCTPNCPRGSICFR